MQPVVRANSIIAVRVFTRVASFCDPGWTFSLPGTTYNSLFYPEDKDHMLHTRTAWVGSEAAAETAAAAALRLRFFLWNSSPTSPRDARSGVAIACTCACVCMFVCVYTHYKRTRARTHTQAHTLPAPAPLKWPAGPRDPVRSQRPWHFPRGAYGS